MPVNDLFNGPDSLRFQEGSGDRDKERQDAKAVHLFEIQVELILY